jgi:Protein of unknown function (DUF4058)
VPSPFPGMDPYLEDARLWPAFQQQFVTCLCQILLPSLVDRYHPRAAQRTYQTEVPLFTSVIREEHAEPFIEVRRRGDSRLVTVIDVVSPANRTTPQGRTAYLAQRRLAQQAGANVVEIDLVLQGQPTLDYPRDGLPDWDYTVTVAKADKPEHYEIYTTTVRERLKKFSLPLAKDDRGATVDLQAVFARCYDQSGYAKVIDYAADPPVPLEDADRRWLDALLRQQKLRR